MLINHCLLDRMERTVCGQILDGDHLRPVHLPGQQDAGIDWLIDNISAAQPGENDRAGTTIALVAPLFGAGGAPLQPQMVEQRQAGVEPLNCYYFPPPEIAHGLPLHRDSPVPC